MGFLILIKYLIIQCSGVIARQSPLCWHTPSMGVGEGLAQNTETETRHQEDVDIGSAQNKGQLPC